MSVRGSLFACAAALFCGLFQIAGIAKTIHAAQAFARPGASGEISGDYGSFTPEDVRSHDGPESGGRIRRPDDKTGDR